MILVRLAISRFWYSRRPLTIVIVLTSKITQHLQESCGGYAGIFPRCEDVLEGGLSSSYETLLPLNFGAME